MTSTAWSSRPGLRAASPEELAALLDREVDRVEGLLFTATPREDLDVIGRFQQAKDQAFAGQLRAIVASLVRTPQGQREFVADEVALALGISPTAGTMLVDLAGKAGELPGLIEALEHDLLSERHLRCLVDELHLVPLSLEQRQTILLVVLARYAGETPGELQRLVRRLILTVDPVAARQRKQVADRKARVSTYALPDGQGALHAVGPLEQIAAIRAALDAAKATQSAQGVDPADERSAEQREFDLLVALITGQVSAGQWHAHIVVPFSAATGDDRELAEIPGLGPILPATARDLLDDCTDVTQVAVDPDGHVTDVSDLIPVRRPEETSDGKPQLAARGPVRRIDVIGEAIKAMTAPPVTRPLASGSYRPGSRLRRFVETRDRTCVFPGCTRPATQTDKDHRRPWPQGPTTAQNLQCLCRRHHRAKQASFVVQLSDDGDYLWITRGGWVFLRRTQGF